MIVDWIIRVFALEMVPQPTGFVPLTPRYSRDGDWDCQRCTSAMRKYRVRCSCCGLRRFKKQKRKKR